MTHSLKRRRFLALTAVSTLAGCNGRLPGTGPKTIDGDRLRRMATQDAPSAPETLPVAIEASFVTAQADVARQLLAEVPAPFDSEDIPNGAIRQRLNQLSEDARERVRGVADAQSSFERLEHAGRARASAREVWAAWQAIDADLTVAAVREDAPAIRDEREAFVSRWSYVGTDPVRAVRVHAELERVVRGDRTWTTGDKPEHLREDGPFDVARVAEDLERTRAAIAATTYIFDRFRESLDGASDLQPRLTDARQQLGNRVQQQATSLPDVDRDALPAALVDRDVGETAGVWALHRLFEEATGETRDVTDASEDGPRLATDILEATRALVFVRAFDHLRKRIEEGDDVAIASAADVVALREAAVAAVEAAREADDAPEMLREVLPRFARHIRFADGEFKHTSGSVSVSSIKRDAAEYVVAAETCQVLPDVAAYVWTILSGSSTTPPDSLGVDILPR